MKGLFYGWKMVAAGGGIQFLQASLLLQSFGAYVAVLRDDRGWSKTELSFAAALHQMEAAIIGPALGWIIDRFGARRDLIVRAATPRGATGRVYGFVYSGLDSGAALVPAGT